MYPKSIKVVVVVTLSYWPDQHDWLFLCRNQPRFSWGWRYVYIPVDPILCSSDHIDLKVEAMGAMSTTNWDPFITSPWPVEAGFELFTPLGNPSVCTFLPVNIGPHSDFTVEPKFFCDFRPKSSCRVVTRWCHDSCDFSTFWRIY